MHSSAQEASLGMAPFALTNSNSSPEGVPTWPATRPGTHTSCTPATHEAVGSSISSLPVGTDLGPWGYLPHIPGKPHTGMWAPPSPATSPPHPLCLAWQGPLPGPWSSLPLHTERQEAVQKLLSSQCPLSCAGTGLSHVEKCVSAGGDVILTCGGQGCVLQA